MLGLLCRGYSRILLPTANQIDHGPYIYVYENVNSLWAIVHLVLLAVLKLESLVAKPPHDEWDLPRQKTESIHSIESSSRSNYQRFHISTNMHFPEHANKKVTSYSLLPGTSK